MRARRSGTLRGSARGCRRGRSRPQRVTRTVPTPAGGVPDGRHLGGDRASLVERLNPRRWGSWKVPARGRPEAAGVANQRSDETPSRCATSSTSARAAWGEAPSVTAASSARPVRVTGTPSTSARRITASAAVVTASSRASGMAGGLIVRSASWLILSCDRSSARATLVARRRPPAATKVASHLFPRRPLSGPRVREPPRASPKRACPATRRRCGGRAAVSPSTTAPLSPAFQVAPATRCLSHQRHFWAVWVTSLPVRAYWRSSDYRNVIDRFTFGCEQFGPTKWNVE